MILGYQVIPQAVCWSQGQLCSNNWAMKDANSNRARVVPEQQMTKVPDDRDRSKEPAKRSNRRR